jgi:hypothetical protein
MTATPNKNAGPASTGFTLVESILHEYRDTGRSATLDRIQSRCRDGLQKYQAAGSPKAAKESLAVETAVDHAVELIQTLLIDAKHRST